MNGIEGIVDGAPEIGLNDGREVTLDGSKVGEAGPKKSDGLGRALQLKKSSSGRVAYAFGPETQWTVVRGLLDTAAKAGYPHASFVTRVVREGVARPGHLDVEVATEKKTTSDRELHVSLSSRGAVMLRWLEGTKQIGEVVPTDAVVTRLARPVEREWNDRGLFHEPNDKRFDQVILHVEPDTPYILVLTVLDAISGTKRGSVPAFIVNLPAEDKTPEHTIGSPSSKPR
ncbi:TolR protein [Labilithrix luteola]|uniref:TolR protein n=1 Tax=Labilithrix luteola TaxID=1391654 RepID=A0A0K1Q327_9BACT|nr:TolR protein [Labilithrix luteola]